ncbi:MAG: ORF6N domain-containing protein [Candidatus Omnitrophota bacterium]
MFQLTQNEKKELVTNCDRFKTLKHSSVLPYAYTELGVAMLSSVLNSEQAIAINMQIMRVFTKLKDAVLAHRDLTININELETKYDQQFQVVFKAIKLILEDKQPGDDNPRRF